MKRTPWILSIGAVLLASLDAHADTHLAKCADNEGCYDRIELGTGLPAISFNMADGTIGLFDSVSLVQLGASFKQFQYKRGSEEHRLAFWRFAFGVDLVKDQASNDLVFGFTLTPWSLRIDDLAIGIGASHRSVGKLDLGTLSNYSVVVPVSYSFGF